MRYLFRNMKYDPTTHATKLRSKIAPKIFKSFGKDSIIKDGVTFRGMENIEIGDGCSINQGCFFSGSGTITIGNQVRIAHDCSFHTASHNFSDVYIPITDQGGILKEIRIENDVWIGCHSIVLQGVTIGKGSIIGANSLVNTDIPQNAIAVGSPAKVIRQRE